MPGRRLDGPPPPLLAVISGINPHFTPTFGGWHGGRRTPHLPGICTALLTLLVEGLAGASILVLAAFRPGYRPR
jgi:hypothetical protein